jgi:predicted nuclease of predicted toxin-antitoxin system
VPGVNFLVDHDVPDEIGRVLVQAGHTVACVRKVLAPTATDDDVFHHATKHNLVLITCNRDDFLHLTRGKPHPGLIVLIRRRTRIAECSRLVRLLNAAGASGVVGNTNFA